MAAEFQALVFSFHANIKVVSLGELKAPQAINVATAPVISQSFSVEAVPQAGGSLTAGTTPITNLTTHEIDTEIIHTLLPKRQEIANEIEDEIAGTLPLYTVQVELSFRRGSVLAIGTVLLTSLGGFIWEATKPEITTVLQFAIKRALQRVLPAEINPYNITSIDVTISQTTKEKKQTVEATGDAGSSPRNPLVQSGYLTALVLVNTILLLILLIIILIPHLRILP